MRSPDWPRQGVQAAHLTHPAPFAPPLFGGVGLSGCQDMADQGADMAEGKRKWTRIIAGQYELVGGDGKALATVRNEGGQWTTTLTEGGKGPVPADTYKTAKLIAEHALDVADAAALASAASALKALAADDVAPAPAPDLPGACQDCGGKGGGGTMDPDTWIPCGTCSETGLALPSGPAEPAPWFGAPFSGGLACGHVVAEGDSVRSARTGPGHLECYAYCGQDDPADPVAQSDPDEPQAWERPTAANVVMPDLPTLPVDETRVSRLDALREHTASSAPVVAVPNVWDALRVGTEAIKRFTDGFSTPQPQSAPVDDAEDVPDVFQAPHTMAPPVFDGTTPDPSRPHTNSRGYLIKDPALGDFRRFKNGNILGITRATTFNKAASDNTALVSWGKRNVVVGASRRPDLIAQAHGKHVAEDKGFLDELVEALEMAADAKVSADVGTLVHTYTEELDAGKIALKDVPPAYRGPVMSYRAALESAGLEVVPGLMEGTVCTREFGGVAGKFDRILRHVASGTYVMGDLKTGRNMTYGWDEIELQEWIYTDGYNRDGTYDWSRDEWTPPEFQVRTDVGVVMWLPVQQPSKPFPPGWDVRANGEPQAGVCYLLRTDLQRGRRHGELCLAVKEGRANKGAPVRWVAPDPNWDARFSSVADAGAARALWLAARDAGLDAAELGRLAVLAMNQLGLIGSQVS